MPTHSHPRSVPNLDAMPAKDLMRFAERIGCPPGHNEGEQTTRLLHFYAVKKSRAMRYRLQGDIQNALVMERECDSVYARLPGYARW